MKGNLGLVAWKRIRTEGAEGIARRRGSEEAKPVETLEKPERPQETPRTGLMTGPYKPNRRLVGKAYADFVGYFQGVFYAGADCGAVQIVAHKVEAREIGA